MRPKIFQLVFHVILGNGPNLGAETENSICSGVDIDVVARTVDAPGNLSNRFF
jgi:hypothetical protein